MEKSRIEEIKTIFSKYTSLEEELKNCRIEINKKRNLLTILEREYEETIQEYGEHTADEYGRELLNQYRSKISSVKEEIKEIQEKILQRQAERLKIASDENVEILLSGVEELRNEIKMKKMELKHLNIELTQYYLFGKDSEAISQDFLNKQGKLKSEFDKLLQQRKTIEKLIEDLRKSKKITSERGKEEAKNIGTHGKNKKEDNNDIHQDDIAKKSGLVQDDKTVNKSTLKAKMQNVEESKADSEVQTIKEIETKPEAQDVGTPDFNNIIKEKIESAKQLSQTEGKNSTKVVEIDNLGNYFKKRPKKEILKSIYCTVRNGELVYLISYTDENEKEAKLVISGNSAKPRKMNKIERYKVEKAMQSHDLSSVDLAIARTLSKGKLQSGEELYNDYLDHLLDSEYAGTIGVDITYNLENLSQSNLSAKEKRILKKVARIASKEGLANYTKPKSKIKSFFKKFTKKKIEGPKEGIYVLGEQRFIQEDEKIENTYKQSLKREVNYSKLRTNPKPNDINRRENDKDLR